jgi:hypothetical protein
MELKRLLLTTNLVVALIVPWLNAQSQGYSQEELIADYRSFFEHQREEIFLHLPKHVFYPGEPIRFAGYVFDNKKQEPAVNTTNIYCALYDDKGELINQKLFYAEEGCFRGVLTIPDDKPAGKYYIKSFTNWMKNFDEVHSYVQAIHLLEDSISRQGNDKPKEDIFLTINPEGGKLIAGVQNSVGFSLKGGRSGNSRIVQGQLIDDLGRSILEDIDISPQGYGKVSLTPEPGKTYYLEFTTAEGTVIREQLPAAQSEGIAVSLNPLHPNGIAVEINTATTNYEQSSGFSIDVALHRDGKIKLMRFELKPGASSIFIPKKQAFPGLNMMSIFDAEEHLLAERIFFNNHGLGDSDGKLEVRPLSHTIDSAEVELNMNGLKRGAEARLSLSILPKETLAYNPAHSIRSWLLFQSYFDTGTGEMFSLGERNRLALYNLDLFLLNNSWNRYSWDRIKQEKPTITHNFDSGITVSGTIKGDRRAREKQLMMYQKSVGVFYSAEIAEDLSFSFDNVYVVENDPLLFFVEDHVVEKWTRIEVELTPQHGTEPIMLERPYLAEIESGPSIQTEYDPAALRFPADYELDEVVLTAKKEPELNRNKILTIGIYEGRKIDEEATVSYPRLSDYLRKLGFKVLPGDQFGEIEITGKYPFSSPPVVFLDGFRSPSRLYDIDLDMIDEIYFEHSGAEGSSGGSVYIYQRFGPMQRKRKVLKHLSDVGFSTEELERRFKFTDFVRRSFLTYGNVHWESDIRLKGSNTFKIRFPHYGLKDLIIYVNGFTDNGELISHKLPYHID